MLLPFPLELFPFQFPFPLVAQIYSHSYAHLHRVTSARIALIDEICVWTSCCVDDAYSTALCDLIRNEHRRSQDFLVVSILSIQNTLKLNIPTRYGNVIRVHSYPGGTLTAYLLSGGSRNLEWGGGLPLPLSSPPLLSLFPSHLSSLLCPPSP